MLKLRVESKRAQDLIDDTFSDVRTRLHLSGMFLSSLQLYHKVLLYV